MSYTGFVYTLQVHQLHKHARVLNTGAEPHVQRYKQSTMYAMVYCSVPVSCIPQDVLSDTAKNVCPCALAAELTHRHSLPLSINLDKCQEIDKSQLMRKELASFPQSIWHVSNSKPTTCHAAAERPQIISTWNSAFREQNVSAFLYPGFSTTLP